MGRRNGFPDRATLCTRLLLVRLAAIASFPSFSVKIFKNVVFFLNRLVYSSNTSTCHAEQSDSVYVAAKRQSSDSNWFDVFCIPVYGKEFHGNSQ